MRRIGKRIVLAFDDDLFLVIHLMIAGRLRWREPGKKSGMGPKLMLASFVFEHGTLFFTEASSKKRASLQVVRGEAALRALDPGGVEPLEATREQFHEALTRESHTLKRTLTDPHLFSGIGNAYSDEISARRAAVAAQAVAVADRRGVRAALRRHATTLQLWVERLRAEVGDGFPEKVTAFRDGMAVHGRFKLPCPVCGRPVQRITRVRPFCRATTSATTARRARPTAGCWPTVPCPGCSGRLAAVDRRKGGTPHCHPTHGPA